MSPSTVEESRPSLALVLGAGGTKGWAHVGVIKVLHEAGVRVDLIVGASAGALIGPLYAARGEVVEAERIAMGFTPTEFLQWFLNDLRVSPRGGRMGRRLWQAYGRLDFSELAIPFAAVALDLTTVRHVVLRSGNVGHAVEASIRPPVISRPIPHGGLALVDGGLQSAVPVAVARDLGAAAVVSVNIGELITLPRPLRPLSARVGAAYRARSSDAVGVRGQVAFLAGLLSHGRRVRARADIEIRPDLRGVSPMWPWHIRASLRRGEEAARRALPAVQSLLAGSASAPGGSPRRA